MNELYLSKYTVYIKNDNEPIVSCEYKKKTNFNYETVAFLFSYKLKVNPAVTKLIANKLIADVTQQSFYFQ